MKAVARCFMVLTLWGCVPVEPTSGTGSLGVDKLTYHVDAARSGWNSQETVLTPDRVSGPDFQQLWSSPVLDSYGVTPPRLFATPLYVASVQWDGPDGVRWNLPVVYAASSTGFVYAIAARTVGDLSAGKILWRRQVTPKPCRRGSLGILSTPVIDRSQQRIYLSFCDEDSVWNATALDLRDGGTIPGWPVQLSAKNINAPGINANGSNQFPAKFAHLQRAALNLSPNGERLYVAFGGEPTSGWMIGVDTVNPGVATAFSASRTESEGVGGMWAAGGPAVDAEGFVYMSTGSSVLNTLAGMGIAGVYPDSDGNWGQSVIQLADSQERGFELAGTYTPFNYCQAGANDIDLGASSPVVIDVNPTSATPSLLALGGAKQGNAYLLNRAPMPGDLTRRPACSEDSRTDRSLLAPQPQPQFGQRGPINVFGPYRESDAMGDQSRSRSTLAHFKDSQGTHFLYLTGSTKTGPTLSTNIAPSLVRMRIVSSASQPSYLKLDPVSSPVIFQNPGSPMISSDGPEHGIIWVLDPNKPRSASLYGPYAAKPVLYAIDASTLELLWRSQAGELGTSGKYNEVTVADGRVYVGTNRIQAFGLGQPDASVAMAQTEDSPLPAAVLSGGKLGQGKALYQQRCMACHEEGQASIASRLQMAQLSAGRIVEKLIYGSMQTQSLGLTEQQIHQIALYLTTAH